jgi:ADP-ribosyl-[dinitrogen reductase] hydrolase
MTDKERYIATLLGCGLGDILGMPVEGWKHEQILKYAGRITKPMTPIVLRDEHGELIMKDEHGPLKYYTRDLEKGEITDDTILTLASAESIAELGYPYLEHIAKKQLQAYESCRQANGHVKGGFGRTTQDAFKRLEQGYSALESGIVGGPGNGPTMKIAPFALYRNLFTNVPLYSAKGGGEFFEEYLARITHLDPRSVVSSLVQSVAVQSLLRDINKPDFLDLLVQVCKENEKPVSNEFLLHEAGSLTRRLEWIKQNTEASCEEAYKTLGNSSLVFESYPFTLFMFQKYWAEPLEGLLETVNYGGDCDTTGAIFGTLAGAKNGMIFPEEWLQVLKSRDKLEKAATDIYNLGERTVQDRKYVSGKTKPSDNNV